MKSIEHGAIRESEQTCYACPDQHEGTLIGGVPFYFRYRFGTASLTVGDGVNGFPSDYPREYAAVSLADSMAGVFDSDEQRDAMFDTLLRMVILQRQEASL